MRLATEIGTAKDNLRAPVHGWYKFTAGFSYNFVEEIIRRENLGHESIVFDPFAGCGTTLVTAQRNGIRAVGNEAQAFMHGVIQAKLDWSIENDRLSRHLMELKEFVKLNRRHFRIAGVHPLLRTLYNRDGLVVIHLIRDYLKATEGVSASYHRFLKLALSQLLHRIALHPISVPYIVRGTSLIPKESAWDEYEKIVMRMLEDVVPLNKLPKTARVYKHDSRRRNRHIEDQSCAACITSPPYLNNLDYGESSKVHSHFFGETENWNDITQKVRKKLVTGATTHYVESEFSIDEWGKTDFAQSCPQVASELLRVHLRLKQARASKKGRSKSYNTLALLYFKDMFSVLVEIRRVLQPGAPAFLVVGDSAPYGVSVATTRILADIARNVGFAQTEIHPIRKRGTKWTTLTHRHSKRLSENLLVLR